MVIRYIKQEWRKKIDKSPSLLTKMIKTVVLCSMLVTINSSYILSEETVRQTAVLKKSLNETLLEFYKPDHPIYKFYSKRNFESFWVNNANHLKELSKSIETANYHGLPESRYPINELRQVSFETSPSQKAKIELMATEAFVLFSQDLSNGILIPKMIDANISIVPERKDTVFLLQSLEEGLVLNDFFSSLLPKSREYQQLLIELSRLREVARSGDWGNLVPTDAVLAVGMVHDNVAYLRSRLYEMGYPVENSGSRVFDKQLNSAVKRFQEYHGLNPDGVFGKRSLEAINVPAKTRLIQILVNLERMRWNNIERGREYILVNQPSFHAYLKKENVSVWDSRVVIGLPSNQTAEFNDVMTHMVVNPTWHVPKSIAVDEYLPLIQSDPNFLSDNEMVLMVRGTNTIIDSNLIDMQAFTPENFPFLIKQVPSNINALGLVKFMFPNKFSIYMHDTPMKDLFFKDERTFSHGCIRLQEPFEFAYTLLRDQTDDPENAFQEILLKEKETYVNLSRDIPVYITYRTAFFDDFGQVHYRADVYGRDALVYMALSEAGVSIY
ncbi:L,D-transpeptidase family protein [Paracoccaceae bacterium]|nr:L,D-transpeptidase family protein [Paracoccaceae bacterium]